MRRLTGWVALAALALLGGCASPPPPEAAAGGRPIASRSPVVPCSTTDLLIATVSKCGAGGFKLGVAAD